MFPVDIYMTKLQPSNISLKEWINIEAEQSNNNLPTMLEMPQNLEIVESKLIFT